MRWHCVFAVHYHSQSFTVICFLEWWLATDQHEEDDPQTPYICKYKGHVLKKLNCWGHRHNYHPTHKILLKCILGWLLHSSFWVLLMETVIPLTYKYSNSIAWQLLQFLKGEKIQNMLLQGCITVWDTLRLLTAVLDKDETNQVTLKAGIHYPFDNR